MNGTRWATTTPLSPQVDAQVSGIERGRTQESESKDTATGDRVRDDEGGGRVSRLLDK